MTDPIIIAAGQLIALACGPQPGRPVCFSLIQAWILSFSSGTEIKITNGKKKLTNLHVSNFI